MTRLSAVPKTAPANKPAALFRELEQLNGQDRATVWRRARIIAAIVNGELWRHYTYTEGGEVRRCASRDAWVRVALKGIYDPSNVSRIVRAVTKIDKLDPEARKPYERAHLWTVVEAFEAESQEEVLRHITSGDTSREIRAKVKARRERQNGPESHVPAEPSYLPLGLPEMAPASIVGQLDAVLNLARFRLEQPTPSVFSLLEHVLVSYVQEWQRDTDPATLGHETSDGVVLTWTPADIMRGVAKCHMCGNWDHTTFDPHHVIPRGRQKACCGTSHEKPIELLCRHCHDTVKKASRGDWAVWGARWGYGELVKAHGGRFDENEQLGVER